MFRSDSGHPVDEVLPLRKMLPFALQHVLVMAASPIAAVILISGALQLPAPATVGLYSVTFVLCGIGALVQSLGPWKIGVRLPLIMGPGGAPIILFIAIATQNDAQTAAGAVIMTGVLFFLLLPIYTRALHFFPPVVMGILIIVIGINLVKVAADLIVGEQAPTEFGDPVSIGLALATIGITVVLFRVLRGVWRQMAVLLGLLAGTAIAIIGGFADLGGVAGDAVFTVPTAFPFGVPHFDILAALPLLIFSVVTMAEATGQTVACAEVVEKDIDQRRDVPKTIRGDGLVSVLSGIFGSTLFVTYADNIGIVRVTGIRSRFVVTAAGVLLVLIGILAPIGRLVSAIPAPVVGGTALVIYATITVMGVNILRRADFSDRNVIVAAVALGVGLLPILVPDFYDSFPEDARILLGSGVAMTAFMAVILNIVFNHLGRPEQQPPQTESSEDSTADEHTETGEDAEVEVTPAQGASTPTHSSSPHDE